MPAPRTVRLLSTVLLVALVWIAFAPVLGTGFLCTDDDDYVTANAAVRAGLTSEGWTWAWTTFRAAHWHPLTWLSLMADVELQGLDPAGFHRTNLVLHAATAVAFAVALHDWTRSWARSWFAAALFALHPMRLESVAWITERKDVLSGLFAVLALFAYGRYARAPRWTTYALVLVLHALGLLAKPMAVTLPAVMLLLDVWPLGRWSADPTPRARLRLVLEKLPLVAVSCFSAWMTMRAQASLGALSDTTSRPLDLRVTGAFAELGGYLLRTVWPARLAVFYPVVPRSPGEWLVPALLITALAVWVVRTRVRRPWVLVGGAWFAGMLLPVLGLVSVGSAAAADRFTYLPAMGLAVALVWSVPEVPQATWRFACGAVVVALALATRGQTDYWQSSLALYERTLEVTRDNVFAEMQVATLRLEGGDGAGARRHAERAFALVPDDPHVRLTLGNVLTATGDPAAALPHLRLAVTGLPFDAGAKITLAGALEATGDLDAAEAEYRRAMDLRPDLAIVPLRLGLLCARRNRLGEARGYLEAALRLDPRDPNVHTNLGNVAALRGQREDAVRHHADAHRLAPGDPRIAANLAAALIEAGRAGEAVPLLESALGSYPQDAALRSLLSRARGGR